MNTHEPGIVGELEISSVEGVAVDGSRVFFGSRMNASPSLTREVDATDPSDMREIGSILSGAGQDLEVYGDWLLVAAFQGGLMIHNVGVPGDFRYSRRIDVGENSLGLAVEGSHVYMATSSGGLQIYDLDAEARPVKHGRYTVESKEGVLFHAIYSAAEFNGFLYTAFVESVEIKGSDEGGAAASTTRERRFGVEIAEIRDQGEVHYMGRLDREQGAFSVTATEGMLLVSELAGLRVFTGDPRQGFSEAGFAAVDEGLQQIIIVNGFAFVRTWTRLVVVDVREPSAPVVAASLEVGGRLKAMRVVDELAYLISDEMGLIVVEVSDPYQPAEIGRTVDFGLTVDGLGISDGFAYTAVSSGGGVSPELVGLNVFDVREPTNPQWLGVVEATAGLNFGDVAIAGKFAYASTRHGAHLLWVFELGGGGEMKIVGNNYSEGLDLHAGSDFLLANLSDGVDVFQFASEPTDGMRLRLVRRSGSLLELQLEGVEPGQVVQIQEREGLQGWVDWMEVIAGDEVPLIKPVVETKIKFYRGITE